MGFYCMCVCEVFFVTGECKTSQRALCLKLNFKFVFCLLIEDCLMLEDKDRSVKSGFTALKMSRQ